MAALYSQLILISRSVWSCQLSFTHTGAGQDVGRSCVIVVMGGKTIMFDCGMHMGYDDGRRFPDFTLLATTTDYTQVIDLVVISHL